MIAFDPLDMKSRKSRIEAEALASELVALKTGDHATTVMLGVQESPYGDARFALGIAVAAAESKSRLDVYTEIFLAATAW